ncbi:hypothetical protein [Marinoscillum pacificum]|uniref:hypothetical protein n=1 Tax=Marinoscillum pacificum TaxID=392723 RepID=UPI002157730F|nr:hypothetical protein [Marinoscillum pacificum]
MADYRKYILKRETLYKLLIVVLVIITAMLLMHLIVGLVKVDLIDYFNSYVDTTSFIVDFAPEIWLTLLSIVLGTLIIVISIASQSNPKLIDYYLGDYPSLYYTSAITLAAMEGVYLQLNLTVESVFWNNILFLNSYVLLPVAILNAIPYTFYILSYTKTSSLIDTIYVRHRIVQNRLFRANSVKKIEALQLELFDTINQLDDQHGFIHYKEPKSQIISILGELLTHYIHNKNRINTSFFTLSEGAQLDISFRTLSDKFDQIAQDKTIYEHKIFRIYSGIYSHLMDGGHHDLASQCANELTKIGYAATASRNPIVTDLTLMQFNTLLRFGIKYATQTKDIRHVYNSVFHYTQLIMHFVETRQEKFLIKSCEYLTYYGTEIYKLSLQESQFIFLIDAFASEIQRILIAVHDKGYEERFQVQLLKIYANLEPDIDQDAHLDRVRKNMARSVKIALILYYVDQKEEVFVQQLIDDIVDDLRYFESKEVIDLIKRDCQFLAQTKETFWEYTDRGDKNIYYTPYKKHLKDFYKTFLSQFIQSVYDRGENKVKASKFVSL